MAIIYPLKHYWWSGSHTTYIICIIWILSLTTASPLLYYSRAVPFNYSGLALYDCREQWEGELSSRIYTVILFFITFIIPFISLNFLYGSIGIKTFKNIQPGEALTTMERAQHRIKIKVFLFIYLCSLLRLIGTRRCIRNELLSTGFAIIPTHKLRIYGKRTDFLMIHSFYIQFLKEL
jgi:hypothetical protein